MEAIFKSWNIDPVYGTLFPTITLFYVGIIQAAKFGFRNRLSEMTPAKRHFMESCWLGITHSLTCMAICCLILSGPYPNDGPLSTLGKLLLTNSFIYLMVDSYVLRESKDLAMSLHHWLGAPLFVACMYQNCGEGTVAAGLLLAEPTSPLLNMKILIEMKNGSKTVHKILEAAFAFLFLTLRVVPYYNILMTMWTHPGICFVTAFLGSINTCLSTYWSYIILCKFLKEFTRKDGPNNLIVSALNGVKNFTSKNAFGKTLLFSSIFFYGMVSPHMRSIIPFIQRVLSH